MDRPAKDKMAMKPGTSKRADEMKISTLRPVPSSPHEPQIKLVDHAFELAQAAARGAAEWFAGNAKDAVEQVNRSERELDQLDHDLDEGLSPALAAADAAHVPELLACLKLMIDLERIGDLLLSAITTARAVTGKLDMEDVHDFIKMCSTLEHMLGDVRDAFGSRNLQMATRLLRADAEIDRLRNLVVLRQLEGSPTAGANGIHVVGIAQTIERAGDHATNLAEEICHLCSGHSLRHARRSMEKSDEQMFVERMRRRYSDRER
jgi:phosphate transport system protein